MSEVKTAICNLCQTDMEFNDRVYSLRELKSHVVGGEEQTVPGIKVLTQKCPKCGQLAFFDESHFETD